MKQCATPSTRYRPRSRRSGEALARNAGASVAKLAAAGLTCAVANRESDTRRRTGTKTRTHDQRGTEPTAPPPFWLNHPFPRTCREYTPKCFDLVASRREFPVLASPMQRDRSIHRMLHRQSAAPRLNQILLQREIPFRRTVRVINQHQLRIMLQSFRLLDHRFLVLPQKDLREDTEDRNRKRQIPRRAKIDPAQVPSHRRHRSPAGKPQLTATIDLRPDIRQHKVNRRRHRLAGHLRQQLVRRAVRAGLVRAHPKSIWNRLILFRLLVNACLASPEP